MLRSRKFLFLKMEHAMFGNHSSSGSVGTLTVLAAVALGALLTPVDCAVVRAQPTDLALGLKNETFALLHKTGADEPAASAAARTSGHPAWVTDFESKTWPAFLTGRRS